MTFQPLIMHIDGLCRESNLSGALPATDELIRIDQPVGQGFKARNLDKDVRTIQESLNQISHKQGGPKDKLKVDGICGPKTNKAIQDFQLKQFGLKGMDGLIEPGKQTIQRINQILFSNLPIDPTIHEQIRVQLLSHINLVSRSIHAAQTNLLLAMAPSSGLDLGGGRANDRLDRHFALGAQKGTARDQTIRQIQGVFTMFANALLMPGALGTGAFEMDPSGDPRIAFTFANGFFRNGEIDEARNIRRDRIFLGRRAFFALSDSELCAFIMLHEMAHFVGFPGGSFILDNGRGWFTDSTISKLSADQRLHNADSYATFAVECRTGNSAKPPYVKAATTSR
ncbi:MAG: peptidoglycan-binding protein [Thermoanaerobaculia bacterium]|nr:peptidoglycan-binding protein [Thermoanaerobaculia bacterium]